MTRGELSGALQAIGTGDIVQTGNMAGVRNAVLEGDVDVLICDTVMPEGDLCELISDIRHARLGEDPFLIIMTLISHPTKELIGRAVSAGADDILLKPFDPHQLCERVKGFAKTRKKFVVTTNYVGPDRRQKPRSEGLEVPQIKVPNPLQMRVTGGMRRSEMRRVSQQAYVAINHQKVERHVMQVAWLMERLEPHFDGREALDQETYQSHLDRLLAVAIDLENRISETHLVHVRPLVMTLLRVATESVAAPNNADKGHWKLLLRLMDALPRAVDPNRGGVAPRAADEQNTTGVSPLLDRANSEAFGPGGKITRSS